MVKSPFEFLTNKPIASFLSLLAACSFAQAETASPIPTEMVRDGWIALFDGHSLFGWRATSDADWKVNDGTIVVKSGERGFLRTTTQFADFELQAEFKAPTETNSGIFIRTPPSPKNPAKDCYEINIASESNPFPTGSIVGRIKGESVAKVQENVWRKMAIKADGNIVSVTVDGIETSRYSDPNPLGRGYISLQLNKGEIAFRNVYLRPLGLKSLFNGSSLEGWKEYDEMQGEYSVTGDGELHVENGRGQLESNERFGDFVLQLECKTNANNLNSGIFFRCIPGDTMMGYESQIHNGFKVTRDKPLDCGTGGIFRRQDARTVVANDLEWFSKTLVAEGPHFAAWVNGYQVSDWTDTRKPHENPRKGLRKEAGTFMIQAHDPTTDILFRNIRAGEMQKRRP